MIEVFGWVAAGIGVTAGLPQLVRILRSKTSAGVSLLLWQLMTGATGAWAVHGYLSGSPQMQLPNVALTLSGAAVIIFIARDRNLPVPRQLLLPLSVALGMSGVNLWLGPLVFGFAIAAPQLVGQVAQFRELLTADQVDGVSAGFLSLSLVVQAMWFTFGLFKPDWALIICAGAMLASCIANLVLYLLRRFRSRVLTPLVVAS